MRENTNRGLWDFIQLFFPAGFSIDFRVSQLLFIFNFKDLLIMALNNIGLFHAALNHSLQQTNRGELCVKEQQYEALKAVVVEGKDTVCVLPTGYGKSLIYQLLPLIFDFYLYGGNPIACRSCIIVVSPLNAIMVDQINKLKEHFDVRVLKSNNRVERQRTDDDGHSHALYDQLEEPSQIMFAHPEVLIEDK